MGKKHKDGEKKLKSSASAAVAGGGGNGAGETGAQNGRKLEKRTNALIGVTGGLAAATVVLAIFTDFKGSESRTAQGLRSLQLAADNRGAMMGWKGSF